MPYLSDTQRQFIKSICISDICREISKTFLEYMNDILSYNIRKECKLLVLEDKYSSKSKLDSSLVKWIKYMSHYNEYSLNLEVTTTVNGNKRDTSYGSSALHRRDIHGGARRAIGQTIRNSEIYCNPCILPNENVSTSPSIFQNSKPNIIISIGEL